MNLKRAVYPGSFDPIHLGHIDIIQRVSVLYDELIVLVTASPEKKYLFSFQERQSLIEKSLSHLKNVKVDTCQGLTAEYAKKVHAQVLIRGLRAVVDFEYELGMAQINKKLAPSVETLLCYSSSEYYYLSSRSIKELAIHSAPLEGLVPDCVIKALATKKK